jgi:hypothetical protein
LREIKTTGFLVEEDQIRKIRVDRYRGKIPELANSRQLLLLLFYELSATHQQEHAGRKDPKNLFLLRSEIVWVVFNGEGEWDLDPVYAKSFSELRDELISEILTKEKSEFVQLPVVAKTATLQRVWIKRKIIGYFGKYFWYSLQPFMLRH